MAIRKGLVERVRTVLAFSKEASTESTMPFEKVSDDLVNFCPTDKKKLRTIRLNKEYERLMIGLTSLRNVLKVECDFEENGIFPSSSSPRGASWGRSQTISAEGEITEGLILVDFERKITRTFTNISVFIKPMRNIDLSKRNKACKEGAAGVLRESSLFPEEMGKSLEMVLYLPQEMFSSMWETVLKGNVREGFLCFGMEAFFYYDEVSSVVLIERKPIASNFVYLTELTIFSETES